MKRPILLAITLLHLLSSSAQQAPHSPTASPSQTSQRQEAQTADICIYGATSAGVIAACAAKRAGKSVILLEPGSRVGGLTTGGLGFTDIGNKQAITGMARDFYRHVGAHYGEPES